MREVISNTSPLQYLYQVELLDLLPALYGTVVVPSGVADELAEGRARGVALPDGLARRYARLLGIPFTGTLGVLLKAKSTGHLARISPVLDRLEALRFRLDAQTRAEVLRLANE